ncbi:5-methyltetrahydropteroyltriglutamate--homocysteine S-methyltransferase [Paenibacillus cymbidii]|uniref:5-methyltetrahydropteroyltriglutamate-- homocysteine S-methyltransferase n=1 Tax=Paenibacillus cymbidii TaxID=1639034 RepID=UPI00108162EC|nr:5-methyltetrahydropteroyltriglutamate--homocysteine S-methyltransferase [Paenibacillus cymbidii]
MKLKLGNLGYPRIGASREWKKTLEQFWSGGIAEEAFEQEMKRQRLAILAKQRDAGVQFVPVGDFSYYDSMLDTSAMFGVVPERFGYAGGEVKPELYFAMARGNRTATACEMTKWFDTNYHYIVPELTKDTAFALAANRPLQLFLEAKQELGLTGKPVIIGPYTYLKLAKGYAKADFAVLLERLVPVYAQVLQELQEAGADWVQLDEPALVTLQDTSELALFAAAYRRLLEAAPSLRVMLQTYFGALDADVLAAVVSLPVHGIGLDFVRGRDAHLAALRAGGWPQLLTLGAGVIDGRNIWRADLADALALVRDIAAIVPADRLIVQPSCSLLHVPISRAGEALLPAALAQALSFADEKLQELALLAAAFEGDEAANAGLAASGEALAALAQLRAASRVAADVTGAADAVTRRSPGFAARQELQQRKWQLPPLPTTTIGSFPQTPDIRKARQSWRKGDWTKEQYDAFIQGHIRKWISLQEDIGLDVLVHGEFERTDMVEFFGEKLGGFAFTANGWVQSYGSRCVKPPVIYADVRFTGPMTVAESAFAQTLTPKPVKGMLTGPVTILNWSFVRDDIPRRETTYQIAAALRQEIEALEAAGVRMIQVDEPALREGLPLKPSERDAYLGWAVEAFRRATSSVRPDTQIHTHMCYCEFHDMIDAISALDADVISIETSRSHGELIGAFESNTYDKGIGLGVYDIHSPRVPDAEEMLKMIERALRVLPDRLFWINPDCGLKTRGETETVAALRNMVQAAQTAREQLGAGV